VPTRERQILDAGARLFFERGFHNVGVDEIGDAVGISGPAIYRHFSGKDEILATLLNEAIDEIIARTEPADDPRVELERLLHAQTSFAVTHAELVSVYTREDRALSDPWRRQFRRRARRHEEHWIDLLRRCYPHIEEDRIAWAAHALMGMIHSVARWSPPMKDLDGVTALISEMAKHALSALEPDDRGAATGPPDSQVAVK
jgi:AcrR family transcriptional regulator